MPAVVLKALVAALAAQQAAATGFPFKHLANPGKAPIKLTIPPSVAAFAAKSKTHLKTVKAHAHAFTTRGRVLGDEEDCMVAAMSMAEEDGPCAPLMEMDDEMPDMAALNQMCKGGECMDVVETIKKKCADVEGITEEDAAGVDMLTMMCEPCMMTLRTMGQTTETACGFEEDSSSVSSPGAMESSDSSDSSQPDYMMPTIEEQMAQREKMCSEDCFTVFDDIASDCSDFDFDVLLEVANRRLLAAHDNGTDMPSETDNGMGSGSEGEVDLLDELLFSTEMMKMACTPCSAAAIYMDGGNCPETEDPSEICSNTACLQDAVNFRSACDGFDFAPIDEMSEGEYGMGMEESMTMISETLDQCEADGVALPDVDLPEAVEAMDDVVGFSPEMDDIIDDNGKNKDNKNKNKNNDDGSGVAAFATVLLAAFLAY